VFISTHVANFNPHEEEKMTQEEKKKGFTPWVGGISIIFIRSLTFRGSFSGNIHREEEEEKKLHK